MHAFFVVANTPVGHTIILTNFEKFTKKIRGKSCSSIVYINAKSSHRLKVARRRVEERNAVQRGAVALSTKYASALRSFHISVEVRE